MPATATVVHPTSGALKRVNLNPEPNSVLQVWWGGSGFGARRFADSGLVFAIGLASLVDWCRARPLVAVGAVLGPLLAANLVLMQDMRLGRIPSGEGLTAPALLGPLYARVGNPSSFPANLAFSVAHKVSPARYDDLGRQLYSTLRLNVGEPDDDRFLTYG